MKIYLNFIYCEFLKLTFDEKKKKEIKDTSLQWFKRQFKKKNAKSTQVSDCMKVYFNVVTFTTYLIQMHYFLIVL